MFPTKKKHLLSPFDAEKADVFLSEAVTISLPLPISVSVLFCWENVPIVEELKKHLDVGIEIANDADAAALGEVYAGAAEGAENAVLLTLGTGVGSGVILDKKIFPVRSEEVQTQRHMLPGSLFFHRYSERHHGV